MEDVRHMLDKSRGFNTICSNGSAHAYRTENIEFVNCPICLDRLGLKKDNT